MDQVHVIRHKVHIEGLSQRQVAEQMGISRNTVKKYVRVPEPVRLPGAPRRCPVQERIGPRLDELMRDWEGRTTSKQRLTASRLYEQLRAEGVETSINTVQRYFREKRREKLEGWVPLPHYAGDEAQVDFFEVTVDIKGERFKCWMFVMRVMYSGRDFAWLYDHCDQPSFLDAHVRAFGHFGGVPGRCVYDNLSAAVKKVLFPGRDLTQRFMALVSHHLFEPCFARPGTGHDKGGVEARGKAIRHQHLVPIPDGDTLNEIATTLLGRLDRQAGERRDREGRTVLEKFQDEVPLLRELPPATFEARLTVPLTVNRKSLVYFKGETYSVPSHWKLLELTAYVGPSDIRFVCREEIEVRPRLRRGGKDIDYTHYLAELRHKPQAVRQVAPELMSALGEPFAELWTLMERTHGGRQAGRVLAKILAAVVEHGREEVGQALRRAIDADGRNLLELATLFRAPATPEIEVPEPLRHYVVEATSAAEFDRLLEGHPS